MTDFLELIKAERARQIEEEGFDHLHDNLHSNNQELSKAAACYAYPEVLTMVGTQPFSIIHAMDIELKNPWPWPKHWDKRSKHNRQKRLVIAAALILAQLERNEVF